MIPSNNMNASRNTTPKAVQSEKDKFLESIKVKNSLGLIDIKFCTNIDTATVDEEKLYGELNRMDAAIDISDPEVLGKFSPVVA